MNKPPLSDLDYRTHYVAAYIPLELCTGDECVDWARDMVAAGRETEHILILAACEKPALFFEIRDYFAKALEEIDYPPCNEKELIERHSSYYVYQLAQGRELWETLRMLSGTTLHETHLFDDFELLWWSWGDLKWGEQYQEYWPGATLANIEELIVKQAQQWLIENEDFLRLKK